MILFVASFCSPATAAVSVIVVHNEAEQLLKLPSAAKVSDLLDAIYEICPSASNPETKPRLIKGNVNLLHALSPSQYQKIKLLALGIKSGTKLILVTPVPKLLFNLLIMDTLTTIRHQFSKKLEIGKWSFLNELISEIRTFMIPHDANDNPVVFSIKWYATRGTHGAWLSKTHCSSTRGIRARIRTQKLSIVNEKLARYEVDHDQIEGNAESDTNIMNGYRPTMMGETYTNIVLPMQYYIEFEEFDDNLIRQGDPQHHRATAPQQTPKSRCCMIC